MLVDFLRDIDHGGYYFFSHKTSHHQELVQVMQVGDWLGSLLGVAVLLVLTVLLFLSRGRTKSAMGALLVFIVGLLLVESLRYLVAGRRPETAQDWIDADEMVRGFPARSVFLLTLAGLLFLIAIWPSVHRWLRVLLTLSVVLVILWVSLSQLVLGLHFTSDVVAALAGSMALGLLGSRFLEDETPELRFRGPFSTPRQG